MKVYPHETYLMHGLIIVLQKYQINDNTHSSQNLFQKEICESLLLQKLKKRKEFPANGSHNKVVYTIYTNLVSL